VNEVWLQCLPIQPKADELANLLQAELNAQCASRTLSHDAVRIEKRPEAEVFDQQLPAICDLQNMPKLWKQVQQASQGAIEDLRLGTQRSVDATWYPWAKHIYWNVLGVRDPEAP